MKATIRVQREDFDLNAEVAALTKDGESGAVASFTGHVRKEGDLSTLTLAKVRASVFDAVRDCLAEPAIGRRFAPTRRLAVKRSLTAISGSRTAWCAHAADGRRSWPACWFRGSDRRP